MNPFPLLAQPTIYTQPEIPNGSLLRDNMA